MKKGASEPPTSKKVEKVDAALQTMGFEIDYVSKERVSGHLLVTPKCCQPFKKLHGGVTALIGEALGSIGAFYAAQGKQWVIGIHLSINHIKSAHIGEFVLAEATPVSVGKTIQVWETCIWKTDPSKSEKQMLISSSRVTVYCEALSENSDKDTLERTKWLAKL